MIRRVLGCAAAAALLGGCAADVGESVSPDDLQTRTQAARPTEGEGHLGIVFGDDEARSIASPEGYVRVWYAIDGRHEVVPTDADDDGIPDFAQMVAEIADDVLADLEARGWPLALTDVGRVAGDDGGDTAFDIYLVDIGSGDGFFVREGCTESPVVRCSGWFGMENDFRGYGYPSLDYAVRVLVSHEYFHAVQAAIHADLPGWASEGTATWNEEVYDPNQSDFERLTTTFFEDPGRSLNSRQLGPFDSFAYGTGLFFWHLTETTGEATLLDAFTRFGAGDTTFEDALVDAVDAAGTDWPTVFGHFHARVQFTGEYTIEGGGFDHAADLPAFDRTALDGRAANWEREVAGWAAVYAELERPRDLTLTNEPLDGWDTTPWVVLAPVDTWADSESFSLLAPGESVTLSAGAPVALALVNMDPTERSAGRLTIRGATGDEGSGDGPIDDGSGDAPIDEDTSSGGSDGCAAAGASPTAGASVALFALALLGGLRRRTRGR